MSIGKYKVKGIRLKQIIEGILFILLYLILERFLTIKQYQERFFPFLPINFLTFIFLANCFLVYHVVFDQYEPWQHLLKVVYIILLICILFIRPPYSNHQYIDVNYLKTWWKYLFDNQVVFINMIGNIVLFIPLGIILKINIKTNLKYTLAFIIIITLELIQLLTKRGIFDFNDIILNNIGSLLGMLLIKKKGDLDEAKT